MRGISTEEVYKAAYITYLGCGYLDVDSDTIDKYAEHDATIFVETCCNYDGITYNRFIKNKIRESTIMLVGMSLLNERDYRYLLNELFIR